MATESGHLFESELLGSFMGTGKDVSTVANLCIHLLQQDVIENANFCPVAFTETFKIFKLPVSMDHLIICKYFCKLLVHLKTNYLKNEKVVFTKTLLSFCKT